jgi:GNAT superfamily N-acetyltransferase
MHGEVSVRPERRPDDGDFLLSLYASTRRPELARLGWSEKQAGRLHRHAVRRPDPPLPGILPHTPTYTVVCVDGERAGRLIVNRADDEIVIVDITLTPKFRRIGVGRGLVRRLLDEADARRVRIRCHVLQHSNARQFWERAGFVAQGGDGVYVAMERAPQA